MEDLARLEVECGGGVSYQLGAAGRVIVIVVWANFFSICFSR
jgi:hypothetical protein